MEGDANEIQKQIESRVNELPTDIQEAILSADLNQKIQSIGTSNKLHLDQVQQLGDMVMLVMLGFMPAEDFVQEAIKQLSVTAETAKKLESDINNQVFLPIRESMKKFAAEQQKGVQAPAVAPTAILTSAGASKAPLSQVLPKTDASAAPVAPAVPEIAPSILPATSSSINVSSPSAPKIDMHPADIALTQKTVAVPPAPAASPAPAPAKPAEAKAVPPKPQDYKTDPYREPVN